MKERYGIAYIPTISLSTHIEGALVNVYAKPYGFGEDPTDQAPEQEQDARQAQELDCKAIRLDWDRVAAPLRPAGLYRSGYAAAAAVRSLGLKKPALAIYQTLHRQAYVDTLRLHPGTEATASNIEGRSGELAMALALLLAASRPPSGLVIATGQLGQIKGTRPEDPDVEVLPVGKLPEKLRLIERLAREKKLPRGPKHTDPVWLFTPTTFDNAGKQVAVETLPEMGQLRSLGITVIPVKTLSEPADRLKARRARWMWQDSAWLGGLACLPLVLGAVIYWWPNPPLTVTSPSLEIRVRDQNQGRSLPLEQVHSVYPDQILDLTCSQHEREFRYLLTVHSHGKVTIEEVIGPKPISYRIDDPDSPSVNSINISNSPDYWVVLLLVSSQFWSETQRHKLEISISASFSEPPKLPDRMRYRFDTFGCKKIMVNPNIAESGNFRGGYGFSPVKVPPPSPECADWTKQILETLNQKVPSKVRLDGYAFQIAPKNPSH